MPFFKMKKLELGRHLALADQSAATEPHFQATEFEQGRHQIDIVDGRRDVEQEVVLDLLVIVVESDRILELDFIEVRRD